MFLLLLRLSIKHVLFSVRVCQCFICVVLNRYVKRVVLHTKGCNGQSVKHKRKKSSPCFSYSVFIPPCDYWGKRQKLYSYSVDRLRIFLGRRGRSAALSKIERLLADRNSVRPRLHWTIGRYIPGCRRTVRPRRVNVSVRVSDTTDSGATYGIDGLLLETENNSQPLLHFTLCYIFIIRRG